MKTPMQELITAIRLVKYSEINEQAWEAYDYVIDIAERMLEKEKDVMCGIYDDAISEFDPTYIGQEKYGEQYYNITFSTKDNVL